MVRTLFGLLAFGIASTVSATPDGPPAYVAPSAQAPAASSQGVLYTTSVVQSTQTKTTSACSPSGTDTNCPAAEQTHVVVVTETIDLYTTSK